MCVTLTKIIFTLKCLKYFYHSSFETPKGEMPKTCFLYGKNPDIFFLLAEWDVWVFLLQEYKKKKKKEKSYTALH